MKWFGVVRQKENIVWTFANAALTSVDIIPICIHNYMGNIFSFDVSQPPNTQKVYWLYKLDNNTNTPKRTFERPLNNDC